MSAVNSPFDRLRPGTVRARNTAPSRIDCKNASEAAATSFIGHAHKSTRCLGDACSVSNFEAPVFVPILPLPGTICALCPSFQTTGFPVSLCLPGPRTAATLPPREHPAPAPRAGRVHPPEQTVVRPTSSSVFLRRLICKGGFFRAEDGTSTPPLQGKLRPPPSKVDSSSPFHCPNKQSRPLEVDP